MTKFKLKVPKVTFLNSPANQANYLCFIASNIATNFYPKKDFHVLPYPFPNGKAVYFPDVNLPQSFWKAAIRNDHNFGEVYPQKMLDILIPKVSVSPNLSLRQKQFQKYADFFFTSCQNLEIFTSQLAKLTSITILPTPYGTGSSFYPQSNNGTVNISLSIRDDRPAASIFRSIIHCLLIISDSKYKRTWFNERLAIVDFLFNETALSKIDNKDLITQKNLTSKELSQSKTYLTKLGFGSVYPLRVHKNELTINNKLASNHLSEAEHNLLKLLFDSKQKVISQETIGDMLWQEKSEELFSPWAITKLVQRLRTKLKNLGVNENLVISAHGKGYYLNSKLASKN